jgi:hypothetical protein
MKNNQILGAVRELTKQAAGNRYYHNAKKLIGIYREVSWGLQYSLNEMSEVCHDMGYAGIEDALGFLEDGTIEGNTVKALEDRALSMRHTALLIKITENALLALREYPVYGERYYDILNHTYIAKYPLLEDELMDEWHISRSTYYRAKKRALSLLGAIIWGYMLPQILLTLNPADTKMTLA